MKIKIKWLALLVLLIALFVRVYKLDQIPGSLYYDEIDLGYQARSLIQTGRDYRGELSPFFVRSFNTDKTPIPVYLSIPATLIFESPELQVRMTTALIGVVVVGLAMILVFLWTKNKTAMVMVGLAFSLNPWLIQFSRIAFEAIYVLFFYLLFAIFLFNWLKTRRLRDYYLSIIFLSLGVYVYRIMSFYTPLTFIIVGAIFYKDIWKVGVKHIILGAVTAAVIILPFLYATTIASADQTRIEQLSIVSDPLIPIFVMRGREVDSGDHLLERVGQRPVWYSYLFHNKVVGWVTSLKNNYLKSFSTELLFVQGDPNLRQGMGKTGALLLTDVVGLIAGLYWVIKNIKKREYQFLALWLLTAPIPADLTFDGAYHTSRLIIFAAPLLIISGLGWWKIIEQIWNLKNKKVSTVVTGMVAASWLVIFINVFHHYLIHFPLESARWHGYGYKQAILKINEIDDQYEKIMMTNSNDPAMMYYLFWANVPASEVQKYGPEFGVETQKNQRLDKYRVMSWSKVTENITVPYEINSALEDNVLYMVSGQDMKGEFRPSKGLPPPGIKIVDYVSYPDNSEVAYYLITKG